MKSLSVGSPVKTGRAFFDADLENRQLGAFVINDVLLIPYAHVLVPVIIPDVIVVCLHFTAPFVLLYHSAVSLSIKIRQHLFGTAGKNHSSSSRLRLFAKITKNTTSTTTAAPAMMSTVLMLSPVCGGLGSSGSTGSSSILNCQSRYPTAS